MVDAVSAADIAAVRAHLANITTSIAALNTLNVSQSQNMDSFFLCTMGALVFRKYTEKVAFCKILWLKIIPPHSYVVCRFRLLGSRLGAQYQRYESVYAQHDQSE